MPSVLTRRRRAATASRSALLTASLVVAGALSATALAACGTGTSSDSALTGANPDHGKQLIVSYGCGSCHTIGGIDTANGTVGPRLTNFTGDRYIAGHLPNTPENTARWIQNPQRYEPGTIMPDLGVTPAQAADIAAYLEGQ